MNNKYHVSPLEILTKFNELNLPKNFCIVPFTNIILNPSGNVSICRQKGTEHIVGSLNDNTIEEIWNSDYLKKWRNEFLTGEISICKSEIANDSCHLSSGNYFYFSSVELDTTQSDLPMKLTANFNGQCNLKCKMCDVWVMENGYYDRINYWKELEEKFFPYIKEIELLSGEPFVQKDTWRLIDSVSSLSPDCLWSFTTNAHYELTSNMKSKLDKVKIKNIIFSVDSFNSNRYEKIRVGGKLSRVVKTIEQYIEYNKSRSDNRITFELHFLFMRDNWDELLNVLSISDKYGFLLTLNILHIPSHDSVLSTSRQKRRKILDYYLKASSAEELRRLTRVIVPIIRSLDKLESAHYLLEFKNKIVGSSKV